MAQIHFTGNLSYLRKQRGVTQLQLADAVGLKRANIGAYEEGRAHPRLPAIVGLAQYFNVTIDSLLSIDITKRRGRPRKQQL